MIDHDDDELRASFRQLREEDAAHAPVFGALAAHAESPPAPIGRRSVRSRALELIAAAATIVLLFGVAREISRRGRDARARDLASPPTASLSLTSWRSPTQGLLNTSGRELLAPSPVLSSVLGDIARLPVQRKGD